MKKIPLGRGYFATIDDEDFALISDPKFSWRCWTCKEKRHYARSYIEKSTRTIFMHQVIAKTPAGMVTDHISGDGLDNRKKNLRVCTTQENSRHRISVQKNNTSGFHGVTRHSRSIGWEARIRVDGKRKYLGYFKNREEAAMVYDEAARKFHGQFATLNFA